MKNNSLLEVSLPTNNEKKIINYINNSKRDNRTISKILAFTNTIVLARNDVEKYQLFAMMLKDYILNKFNGKINSIVELDEIINSIDIKDNKLTKESICLLMQYLEIDDITRFKLVLNFVENVNQKENRYLGIKDRDMDTCYTLCDNFNHIIETKIKKKENNHVLKRVSNR